MINLETLTSVTLSSGSNPVIAVGSASESDANIREPGNVIDTGIDGTKRYWFFYTGYKSYGDPTDGEKIHVAYSSDGSTWVKSSANPIYADRLEDPYCYFESGTYYLFCEDKEEYYDNAYADSRTIRLLTATDPEGTWTNQGTVLSFGTGTEWDSWGVASPVVFKSGSLYYIIYEGTDSSGWGQAPIGIANATAITGPYTNRRIIYADVISGWSSNDTNVPDDIILSNGTYYLSHHSRRVSNEFSEGIIKPNPNFNQFVDNSAGTYFTGEINTGDYAGQINTAMYLEIGGVIKFLYTTSDDTAGIYLADTSA